MSNFLKWYQALFDPEFKLTIKELYDGQQLIYNSRIYAEYDNFYPHENVCHVFYIDLFLNRRINMVFPDKDILTKWIDTQLTEMMSFKTC